MRVRRFGWPGPTPGLALLAVFLVAATAVFAWHPWRSDASANGYRHPASVRTLTLPGGPSASVAATPQPAVQLPAGAEATASAAVVAYLQARTVGNVTLSYALLGPASKRSYPTEATWTDALADLPTPGTFTVTAGQPRGAAAEVTAVVRRTPVLNSFVGFVPAKAVEVYRAVRAGTRWRVEAEPVRVTPELISDRTATSDVTAWLGRLSVCDGVGAAARQVSADLLGDDSLAGGICAAHARLRAGRAQPVLGGPATAPFVAAYGPDLGSWARVVPVTGPGQQLLVGVAPLGASWRVFGIVAGGNS